MRNNISDENKVILYLYQELSTTDCASMEQEMAKKPNLQKEVDALTETKVDCETAEVAPSNKVVDRILAYSRQSQLPQKRAHLDTTHTH